MVGHPSPTTTLWKRWDAKGLQIDWTSMLHPYVFEVNVVYGSQRSALRSLRNGDHSKITGLMSDIIYHVIPFPWSLRWERGLGKYFAQVSDLIRFQKALPFYFPLPSNTWSFAYYPSKVVGVIMVLVRYISLSEEAKFKTCTQGRGVKARVISVLLGVVYLLSTHRVWRCPRVTQSLTTVWPTRQKSGEGGLTGANLTSCVREASSYKSYFRTVEGDIRELSRRLDVKGVVCSRHAT